MKFDDFNVDELLVLENSPVIKYQFAELGKEVDTYLDELDIENMEVTTDNLSLIKKQRTALRKVHNDLEERRKHVRRSILTPYDDFKEVYDKEVGDKLKDADETLKDSIDKVEQEMIDEKTVQFREYFEDAKAESGIDWVEFNMVDTKINLSSTIQSTKDDIDAFFKKVQDDLIVMSNLNEEQQPRVLAMYRTNLDMAHSILTVQAQMKTEKEVKSGQEIKKKQIEKGQIEDDTIYSMTFTVKGTKQELGQVKKFLIDKELEFK